MYRKFICAFVFAVLLCGHAWAYVIINAEIFPDENFRSYVQTEKDSNGDGILIDEEIADVDYINVYDMGISSLKGIEHFTNLEELDCRYNSLAELNVPASITASSRFGEQSVTGQVLSVSTNDISLI